jgi:hypothetical protein
LHSSLDNGDCEAVSILRLGSGGGSSRTSDPQLPGQRSIERHDGVDLNGGLSWLEYLKSEGVLRSIFDKKERIIRVLDVYTV